MIIVRFLFNRLTRRIDKRITALAAEQGKLDTPEYHSYRDAMLDLREKVLGPKKSPLGR